MEKQKRLRKFAVISLVIFSVLLTSLSWASADKLPATEKWSKTYGGSGLDVGWFAQETINGGQIIIGHTYSFGASESDVYLLKTDSQGREEWYKIFGGSKNDYGESVQVTSDGGYIIAGYTESYGAGFWDVYLVKTDSKGGEEWSVTFGGSGSEMGYSVQETSDRGYVISGVTNSFGAGEVDVYLLKTDSQGTEIWNRTFGGSNWDESYSVQETKDGGFIVAGKTLSFGAGGYDVYLVKVGSEGEEEWSRTFGGPNNEAGWSVQETRDGGYIITGHTDSYGAGAADVYLVKIGLNGEEEWSKTFGGSSWDVGVSVQQTRDGGYVIAGYTDSFGAGGFDVYLVKANSQGEEDWGMTFGGPTQDYGGFVLITRDGEYVIGGYTDSFGAGGYDVYLLKVDSQSSAAESYFASISDVKAPSKVFAGESFTMEVTISYGFTNPTEIGPVVYDLESETWITGSHETLEGNGTKTYSLELTAPEKASTWSLEASLGHYSDEGWTYDKNNSVTEFNSARDGVHVHMVEVVETENNFGGEIPGFPTPAIAIGISLVSLILFYSKRNPSFARYI